MKLDTLRQAAGGTLVLHFHKKMLKMIIDYRKAIMVVLPVIFLFIAAGSLRAQDNLTYDYLIELGKDNLREHKYGEALHYFELAQAADPAQSDDCLFYINLVKRLREGKVAGIGLEDYGKKVKKMPFKKKLVKKALDRMEGKLRKKGEEKTTAGEKEKIVAETAKETGKPVRPEAKKSGASLLLTDELWQAESKPVVEMDIGQSLAIEGRNIKRFLVIDPTIVEAARLAPDKINLTPKRAGTTFIHVWDDKGRCTLPVKVLFYSRSSKEGGAAKEKEPELETRAEPFRVNYAVNRQIRYDGNTTPNFSLRSADFTQAASLWGSTPYGDLDFTADIRQFAKAVTLKDYSAGMTNANFGPMRHFNVRWANISPPLSSYSGGGSLRGVLLDDNFFNDKLGYTLFWGRDSGSYGGTLTPGVSPADKNYIEGGKLAFSPFDNHKFNLSLVKGYGQRSVDAADHVFTLLTNDSFGSTSVNSEIGFDGNKYAFNVGSSFPLNGVNLNLNIRHVNQSYSTVTGQAGGRGTSQAQAGMSTSIAKIISLSSSFAVQKDELDRNPGKPHKLNLQSDTGIGFPVGLRGNWQTNVSWSANPGNSFPRRQLRINNTYSRSFKFAGRDLPAATSLYL